MAGRIRDSDIALVRERSAIVVTYDDFNPYLDHFKAAVRALDAAQALGRWRLQDHMDAILAQWEPGPIPETFAAVRDQWEAGHIAITAIKTAGLSCAIAAVLSLARPRVKAGG